MENGTCYAYLLRCADGTLYAGWTNDPAARLAAHNDGRGAKYTRGRLPVEMVYREAFDTRAEAMRREWELKQMTRAQKLALIAHGAGRPCAMGGTRMTASIPDTALTHGGRFHADDVFSAALLKLLNPSVQITRVFDVPENFDGLVFDIGWGRFDHHQKNAPVRPNGVPYAAFGLLWKEFGAGLVGPEEAERFDFHFIQPLDLDDNTGCGSEIAGLIGAFNPSWDSDRSPDDCFAEAVAFAEVILEKRFEGIWSIQRARALVERALGEMRDGIVILSTFAPWKMALVPSPAEFVVYPSQRGGYSAQAVPNDDETHSLKHPFPAGWAGRSEEELPRISGIETLRFCHNNRFLIAAGTLEDAVRACEAARREK